MLHQPSPTFFIVGAPRCGTTSMHDYLRQHPQVFMPPQKEIHFFGNDLNPHLVHPQAKERNAYLAFFAAARPGQRVGEASPFYLYSQTAPVEIDAFCPHARIIIMLRNPTDLAYSWFCGGQFSSAFVPAHEHMRSFEEALRVDARRPRGTLFRTTAVTGSGKLVVSLRELAGYAKHVERYFHTFGQGRIHAILFDDLSRNPAAVYAAVCGFLGIDASFVPEFRALNSSRHARIRGLVRLLVKRPRPLERMARTFLPAPVRRGLKHALWYLATTRPPPMRHANRVRLQEEFADDVRQLQVLLDRSLAHWLPSSSRAASGESR